ncbi:MAG TPA: hypothetical protein VI365_29595 [Trebonia sp.]
MNSFLSARSRWTADEGFASELLWFDAFTLNVGYSQVRYTGYNLLVVDSAPAPGATPRSCSSAA